MARAKMTPRKSTGPKGVPRHQLAPRNDGASSSSSRPDLVTPRVFKILKPDMSSYALQSIWHLVKTLRCIH